jgi:hypothetical protein
MPGSVLRVAVQQANSRSWAAQTRCDNLHLSALEYHGHSLEGIAVSREAAATGLYLMCGILRVRLVCIALFAQSPVAF